MKRSGEEGSSQPNRPAVSSSRVEPPGQAQILAANGPQGLTPFDVLTYLKHVKEAFEERKDLYAEFLEVMKDFKSQRIDTSGVIEKVKELFKGRPDLLLGFNTFLPRGYQITLPLGDGPLPKKKPVQLDEAYDLVNKIKTRFQDDHVYKAFLEILNMYRNDTKSLSKVYQEVSVLFRDHVDLLVEFTHFLPDISGAGSNHSSHGVDNDPSLTMEKTMQTQKDQQNLVEKEKGEYTEDNDGGHPGGIDSIRKSVRADGYETDNSNRDNICSGTQEPGSTFCEKVKERLQESENYEKFLDCVRSYQGKFVSLSQFRMLIAALLDQYPDLIQEIEDFITYIEKTGRLQISRQNFRLSKVEQGDESRDREDKEKRDRYDRGITSNNKDILGQRMSPYTSKDKVAAKPIHELDLSNCNSCTPSYRLLPENYPIPIASFRTKIGDEVLNDQWVSVTSGSEDYSFKHMRKNQYEESLFRCEDDRFELDMLLESVNATAKHVEDLLESLNSRINRMENTFCISNHLSALDIRCIERIYGDHGLEVTDVLSKNIPLVLPVVLTRLKQKQEEWVRCRADFSRAWAEIYAKNYHKSLDHRSFYFKQQDTKNLSAKALLAEIKEISDNNEVLDETVIAVGAGYKQPVRPLEFKYTDVDIHEDLYQLMNYVSEEVCTPEQHDKVMKIWTNFLETLLGIPPRTLNEEENLKDLADTDDNVERNTYSAGERAGNETSAVSNGNMTSARSWAVSEQGPEFVDSNRGIEDAPIQEAQQGDVKPMPPPIETPGEQVNTHFEETDDGGREEGELSPCQYIEGSNQVAQNPRTNAAINMETEGEELFGNGTGEKIDTNGDEEGEGSPHGSLEDENPSENENLSVSESANVEESPDAHDEDVVPNEDDKVESEGEDDHMTDADDDTDAASDSDRFLRTVKPLSIKTPLISTPHGKEQGSQIFYANDSLYLLFRFHQMLYERMQSAKLHSTYVESTWRTSNSSNQSDSYNRFKEALYSLLDGSSDNPKFEDDCRAIIGAQSYVLFTLDKLIHKLLKQLQAVATEDAENKLLQLYAYERSRNPSKFVEAVYYENARFLLPDDNLYRIECFPLPSMRLTIRHLRNEQDKEPTATLMDPDFAAYLHENLLVVDPERTGDGLFLKRNKIKFSTGTEDDDIMKAMEGVLMHNGVEMKVNSKTMKAAYVLGTEDFFYRTIRRRVALYGTSNGSNVRSSVNLRRRSKSLSVFLSLK